MKKGNINNTITLFIFVIALFGVSFFIFSNTAAAATVYVNSSTGNDSTGDGSSGTPYKTFHKGYTEAGSGDTLDLTGTFDWTNADESGDTSPVGYTISKNLTIQGQAADSTFIQAAGSYASGDRSVFTITAGYTVTINDVTIRYAYNRTGSNGGGINNNGTLTVNRCAITENYVWYYPSWGGYGGGIRNAGTLTVNDSTIDNNFAQSQGGGIVNAYVAAGTNVAYITNTTIAFNSTAATVATVGGAGIFIRSGTVYVTNSTIAFNDAPSGTGDTTGIDIVSGTTLHIKNSIVAANEVGGNNVNYASGNFFDIYNDGTLNDNGGNIFGKVYNFTLSNSSWYDLYGNSAGDNVFTLNGTASTGSLNLNTSLADNSTQNGTQTLSINASDSVAVNNGLATANGPVSIPSQDQRGASRNSDTDIGAYEYAGIIGAPVVDTFFPVDNATNVTTTANLIIRFDEAVDAEAGADNDIVIKKTSGDTTVETIDSQDAKVSGSGTAIIEINPVATLDESTGYYVQIGADAFDDSESNGYAGISDTTTWSFTTGDFTDPTRSSLFPVDNATNVTTTANLIIRFDEAVDVESGNITIYKTDDDSEVEAIDVTGGKVSGSGTSVIEINPATTLDEQTEYYIIIEATAFDDSSSNSYAGITASSTWSFTTGDFTNPSVDTLSPTDDSTDISVSSNLVITFDEAVDTESGNITIYKTDDDSEVEAIDVTGGLVSGSGSTEITINPTDNLSYETEYYVIVDVTAFDDSSSNSYAGITASSTWSFTTEDTPLCPTIDNAATYNAYPTCGPATCNSGYNLSGSQCLSAGGGGVAAPASQGGGVNDVSVPMFGEKVMGKIQTGGTNMLMYIESNAGFSAIVSKSFSAENHNIKILDLDMFNKKIIIEIQSEPKIIELSEGESKDVDLDGDGINDITLSFNDLLVNRIDLTVEQKDFGDNIESNIKNLENGNLVKERDKPAVYLIQENRKHPIFSEQIFNINNFKWHEIKEYEDLSSILNGEIISTLLNKNINNRFNRNLSLGLGGEDVKELQKYLNNNGFILANKGVGSPGNETEYFGNLTKKALIQFQKAKNITPAVGYFGPITRSYIK